MYEAQTCSACATLVYYPDEMVIGHFEPKMNPEERGLEFVVCDEKHAVDDQVFCLGCAPCECGQHPDLMSDNEAVAAGWCLCGGAEQHKVAEHKPVMV